MPGTGGGWRALTGQLSDIGRRAALSLRPSSSTLVDEHRVSLYRSVLFTPGSNSKALTRVGTCGADVHILDLEDAVAANAKKAARDQVLQFLRTWKSAACDITVRVNSLDTDWGLDDVRALAACPPCAIVLPKVDSADMVTDLLQEMNACGFPAATTIWPIIETPKGVINAYDIARVHPRVQLLIAGTSDLVKDMRARHVPDRSSVLYALSTIVTAARAAGIDCLDGVHLDLSDDAGFIRQCEQGRDLGFDGKSLIHPKTVAPCNNVFSPSPAQLDHAVRVIDAFNAATAKGEGVAVVDGSLVEILHFNEAKRVVALSNAIAERQRLAAAANAPKP